VVVAPVVGPTLGGWISDNWSWQWCFLINAPVGVLAMALIAALLEPRQSRAAAKGRVRIAPQAQAIYCRRRHQPRRPPLAKIRPGRKFVPPAREGSVASLRLDDVARK
jgi:MFS family permease